MVNVLPNALQNIIEVAGFVRNLTDKTYRVDVINLSSLRGAILYAIGDPRTFGVTLSPRAESRLYCGVPF